MAHGPPPAPRSGALPPLTHTHARVPLRVLLGAHDTQTTTGVVVKRDTTPLPASLSHPSSVGAGHVASSSGVFARTGIGLVVVVALIYGIYWLLKRYAGSKNARSDGKMQVLATTALAPNRALHLVSVGDQLVLVGTAEQSVTPVRVYDEEESEILRASLGGEPPPLRPSNGFGGGFGGFVTELRSRTVRR